MRILVIDDKNLNIGSARDFLLPLGHDVVICKSYFSAVQFLTTQQFDVVLTDIMMPANCDGLNGEAQWALFGTGSYITDRETAPKPGTPEVPYGFTLGILAAMRGAKYVGFVSNTDHHADPLSWSLDQISVKAPYGGDERELITINGAKCGFFVGGCCPQIDDEKNYPYVGSEADPYGHEKWVNRPKDWLAVLTKLLGE